MGSDSSFSSAAGQALARQVSMTLLMLEAGDSISGLHTGRNVQGLCLGLCQVGTSGRLVKDQMPYFLL
jgi:hypothetical protein